MSFLAQAKTKRLLSIHGWTGTLLGVLLYVVIFTGAIVVFDNEINDWSRGDIGTEVGIGDRVDYPFRVLARDVDRAYYEEVLIFRTGDGDMRYLFHTHETNDAGQVVERGVEITVDPESGEVLDRWEGVLSERESDPTNALARFWVDLHVQLYLPNPYGLILVGVLGLMMMFAAVSGILIHRHMIRDAFVSGRTKLKLSGARDLHVVAGTWGLPFAFILAFTGAFFGFATSVGVPTMAMVAFDGDQEAMLETLLGAEEEPDLTPAPLAALDFVVRDAEARTGAVVNSIEITNYDSADAHIRVNVGAAPGSLTTQILGFDGVTRSFEGVQPLLGTTPSLGSSLIALIIPLHFGNFAGFASKIVWFGMGLAMAYVSATGLLLWAKRREEVPLWQTFRHWIVVIIWGLPLAMGMSAVTYFLSLPAGDPLWWTPAGFLIGVALVLGLGANRTTAEARLRLVCAGLALGLPVLRHLIGGASWSEALMAGAWAVLFIDLLLLVTGLVLLRQWRRGTHEKPAVAPATAFQEPAE